LSDRQNTTLFMTLLAALNTLFYRLTAQDDICIGTAIANRNCAEVERLIGFFVNMLAIRTNLSGDPTFRELLGRVRNTLLEADAHQDIPFEKLVEELAPRRDLQRSPFFRAVLLLENFKRFSGNPVSSGKLAIGTLPVERTTTPFDLIMSLLETRDGLTGSLFYRIDLFSQKTVDFMVRSFVTILDQVVADPDIRLLDISLGDGNDQAWSLDRADENESFNF
jgi:non-ribosomal peptide synthetase component F